MLETSARHRPGTSTRTLFIVLIAALLLGVSSAHAATNILQRGNGAEPETLDVHKSSGVPEANIQRDLFEGLVAEGADGSIIPGVAESWSLSEDGKVYTFRLRRNAKWSNGDPVTAHDFAFALTRGVDPSVGSDYAFILWPIANAEEITKGKVKELGRLGVKAVDAHTLKLTLKAPTPYFIGLLTHHQAYPVHRKTLEQHGDKWTRAGNMVSNGAYQLAEWVPQSHVRLERNPHYWDAANVRIDAVVFHPTEDKSTELKRFRSGEMDVTYDVPIDQIGWVEKNLAQQFRNTAYLGTYYYSLNLTKTPFRDRPGLRNALAMTIDREILTGKVTKGGEIPAYAWVPPGVNQYAGAKVPWQGLSKAERLARAKKLYAEAGYSKDNPLKVQILYNTSESHKRIAIAIGGMWKKALGVQTELFNQEWKVYLTTRRAKQFDVLRAGWIGDYNDANTFLELLKGTVGTMNPAGYASSEYDALMQKAETETDLQARAKLMQKAESILLADMPIIPIYHYTTQHLVNPRVKGWVDNVMDVHPTRHLSLAP
ncbi:MAG: peptide ABC transporter substrate-binding protein [Deltaproteobacteria bacterium]|nr:peptide ABC transporter substrate-binding protein [Deltaproteobacteria bacterium]